MTFKTNDLLKGDKDTRKLKQVMMSELEKIMTLFDLTNQDCAKILGISHQQVAKYRTGQNQISIFLLKKFLTHYNLTLSKFFEKVEKMV